MNVEKENAPVLVAKDADVGCYNDKTLWAVYLEADAFWKMGEVKLDDCVMILCDGDRNMKRMTGKEYFDAVREHNVKVLYRDILDKTERRYLRNFIRPFRDNVEYFSKCQDGSLDEEYIAIKFKNMNDSCILLPNFKKGVMYKGMKENVRYSVEVLGL